MNRKYIVLITHRPYGKDIGDEITPAYSEVLHDKLFNSKEEAKAAMDKYVEITSVERLKEQFHIDFELFHNLYNFINEWQYINDGKGYMTRNNIPIIDRINCFFKMFAINESYSNEDYEHDLGLYQKIMSEDEPIVKIVEVF